LIFLLSRWSGGLIDRYGAKLPLVIGPVVVAIAFLIFAIPSTGGNYWTTYFPAVGTLGVGMAISVAPPSTAVMNSVPQERAGTASGINNAVSRLAGVLSIAALGVVMLASFNQQLSSRLHGIDLTPRMHQEVESQRVKLAAIEIPHEIDNRLREEIRQSIDRSFVTGFRVVMFVASGLAILSAATAKAMMEREGKD
jgi:MFS family permease